MKYIVVLGDGMADYPIDELNNLTPLQYASTPNMDLLAGKSELGMVKTVPAGFPPGSDVANLSVLGYDPAIYYTGRSPLEALSMGVELAADDIAFRCNLVTLSDVSDYEKKVMVDYSSDEILTADSRILMQAVGDKFNNDKICFYPGISYRHLMVWHGGPSDPDLTPPHDISGRMIGEYLPKGAGAELLTELMISSQEILVKHPVNQARAEKGLNPANSLWFWGQGRKPMLRSFFDKYGLKGSVISAVDLTKGLGISAGLRVVDVPGATGNITTNFAGKANAALGELRSGQDFVYIHIEAPDEAGHRGELDTKIKSIEAIDEKVLGTLLQGLDMFDDYKLMLLPDHPTPLSVRTHVADEVPYLIYQKNNNVSGAPSYNESTGRGTGLYIKDGHLLMEHFLAR